MSEFRLNFAGIGIAKAGTSWISSCLAEHPAVCMAWGKETNFFLLNHISSRLPVQTRYYGTPHYEKGIEWYRALFKHHRPGQLYGEFSNAYIGDPESARLLYEHNPDVKRENLHLMVFDAGGELIFENYGGVDLAHEFTLVPGEEGVLRADLRDEVLEEHRFLHEGVELAFDPYLPRPPSTDW